MKVNNTKQMYRDLCYLCITAFSLLALLTCKKYSATIIVLLCISKDLYSRKDMNLTRFTIDCMLRGKNK